MRRAVERSVGFLTAIICLSVGAVVAPRVRIASVADVPTSVPMNSDLFRNIARQQNPAIVSIVTRSHRRTADLDEEGLPDWLFGEHALPFDGIYRAAGSGFLIGRNGDILTNDHIVAGAEAIEVALFGDEARTYQAVIVGRDPVTDSALIRLRHAPAMLSTATLGDSDLVQPGDWVMAIGNPFQLGHSVTVGVVSHARRPFHVREGLWQNLIQTNASINPGNSGGPLINVHGEVVGITAAVLAGAANGTAGIGFAIPINTIKAVLPQLRSGKVVRGRLGIQYRRLPIAADEARALGLPAAAGVIVSGVERDSPASRAALRAGDVIVAIDEQTVDDANALGARVAATPPGSRCLLRIIRDGRLWTYPVTIGELAVDDEEAPRPPGEDRTDAGLTLQEITPTLRARLRLPPGIAGVVVASVASDSPADRAGAERGDIITAIDKRAIHSVTDARAALGGAGAGQPIFILLRRGGAERCLLTRKE